MFRTEGPVHERHNPLAWKVLHGLLLGGAWCAAVSRIGKKPQ